MNHNSILQKTEEKKNLTQGENTKKRVKNSQFRTKERKRCGWLFWRDGVRKRKKQRTIYNFFFVAKKTHTGFVSDFPKGKWLILTAVHTLSCLKIKVCNKESVETRD